MSLTTTTTGSALAGPHPGSSGECLSEFLAWLQQSGIHATRIRSTYGAGRHFLTWLQADGIGPDGIDDNVLRRFRQHDCRCVHAQGGHYKRAARRSRQYMSRVVELVRFLERTGRTAHPGELEQGFRLAEDFVERCATEGFAERTLRWYRRACRHFLTWLHGTRLRMREMAAAPVLSAFLEHECLCPGGFRTLSPPRPGATRYAVPIEAFTRFLAMRGVIADRLTPSAGDSDRELAGFRRWLRQNRGIRASTIKEYLRTVSAFLPDFGNDPGRYDAALVRDVLLSRCAGVAPKQAQRIATSMRMYLRYLASQGAWPACRATFPPQMSSARSRPATSRQRWACATGPSCCCWPGSLCAGATSPAYGWLTSTGATRSCASAGSRSGRRACRCPRMSATPCWSTSSALVRRWTRTGCSCACRHRIAPSPVPRRSVTSQAPPWNGLAWTRPARAAPICSGTRQPPICCAPARRWMPLAPCCGTVRRIPRPSMRRSTPACSKR